MRTGPSLTEMNNEMILFEYERAVKQRRYGLAKRIAEANPQVIWFYHYHETTDDLVEVME